MDNSLRPLLEKLSGRKMQLVRFHPGLRIYQVPFGAVVFFFFGDLSLP